MRAFLPLLFCLLFAGCYTISKGRYQEISIHSNISGALVEIDGVEMGYTPYNGKIKRSKHGRGNIRVSKPGYAAGEIQMQKRENTLGSVKGNALIGAIAGAPYFISAPLEHSRYKEEKRKFEEKKARGETEFSETGPTDGTALLVAAGSAAFSSVFSFGTSTDGLSSATWEYSPSQYYVQLKEEGQSSLNFGKEVAIRYFATVNHAQISIDANAGNNGGEYMNALSNLMGANANKTNGEIAKQSINEALEKSKGDQVLFGDALIERFRQQEE